MIEYVKNDSINKVDSTIGYPSTFYTDGRIIRFYSKNGISDSFYAVFCHYVFDEGKSLTVDEWVYD